MLGPLSCQPRRQPTGLPAGNNSGFVWLRGLTHRCGEGYPNHAGFPGENGCVPEWWGRAGTPRRAPLALPVQVSPCSTGTAVVSSLKHGGCEAGRPQLSP